MLMQMRFFFIKNEQLQMLFLMHQTIFNANANAIVSI